jgi:succinoglycan biosynthesis protein ExoW
MTNIGVVIPYFQKAAGLLRRSLEGVIAQELLADVALTIVIVDDESPAPLEPEIRGLALPDGFRIETLAQSNAGPGAARNMALDYLSTRDIDFVAFLDSDDLWRPTHLADAMSAMGEDATFYFCDHDRWHTPLSWFASSLTIQAWSRSGDPPWTKVEDRVAGAPGPVYRFLPHRGVSAFAQDYLAQTSTVVYRFSRLADIRFDKALRYAGEDVMFWMSLAERSRDIRFLRKVNVETGQGINMVYSINSWRHPDAARLMAYNLLFFTQVKSRFTLDPAGKAIVAKPIWGLEKTFARTLTRQVVSGKGLDIKLVRLVVGGHFRRILILPFALAVVAIERWRGVKADWY